MSKPDSNQKENEAQLQVNKLKLAVESSSIN